MNKLILTIIITIISVNYAFPQWRVSPLRDKSGNIIIENHSMIYITETRQGLNTAFRIAGPREDDNRESVTIIITDKSGYGVLENSYNIVRMYYTNRDYIEFKFDRGISEQVWRGHGYSNIVINDKTTVNEIIDLLHQNDVIGVNIYDGFSLRTYLLRYHNFLFETSNFADVYRSLYHNQ